MSKSWLEQTMDEIHAKIPEEAWDTVTEMKPCPFCGSDELVPSFRTDLPHMTVCIACDDCDMEGPPVILDQEDRARSLEQAHVLWNMRFTRE